MNTIFCILSILSLVTFAILKWNTHNDLFKIKNECANYEDKELWLPKDIIEVVSFGWVGLPCFYYIRNDDGKYLMHGNYINCYKWTDESAIDGAMRFKSYDEAQTFIQSINHMQ